MQLAHLLCREAQVGGVDKLHAVGHLQAHQGQIRPHLAGDQHPHVAGQTLQQGRQSGQDVSVADVLKVVEDQTQGLGTTRQAHRQPLPQCGRRQAQYAPDHSANGQALDLSLQRFEQAAEEAPWLVVAPAQGRVLGEDLHMRRGTGW